MRRRTLLGGTVLVAAALGAGFAVGLSRTDAPANPKGLLPLPLGEMRFSLSDHEGRNVVPQDLVGRATMVFFGFTSCPDICPTTLADITGWLEALGEDANLLHVVFITVDPARDTVEAMAEYVGYFHPTIRGWTGSPEEIARAADGFRASYERVPAENGNYTMNHTAGVFLFDAEGRFKTIVDYHEPREFALPKIRRVMGDDSGV